MARVARAALAFCLLVGFPDLLPGQATPDADPIAVLNRAVREAEQALAVEETQIAESRYRTALFEGWILLGSLAQSSGDLEEARSAYEAAIRSATQARRARIALAGVLAQLEEFDAAEALLRLLIAEDKADFEARRLLSDTLASAGHAKESIQELEQLVAMNPDDLATVYYLSTAYLAESRIVEADFLLEKIAAAIPTPQAQILIGRAYLDYNFYERARGAFDKAIELDPRLPRVHYYRGTVDVLEQGRDLLESAITYFEKELEVVPGEPTASLYLGISLSEVRRFEQAIPHLEVALEQPEHRAEALRFLGKCLQGLGRTEEAIVAFRRGLEAAAEDVGDRPLEKLSQSRARQIASLHFQLGGALRASGLGDSARVHFDAAKQYQSRGTASARETLSDYLTDASVTRDEVEFGPAESSGPEVDIERLREIKKPVVRALANAYLNLGVLEAKGGEPELAADLFQQAAELDPQSAQIQYSLGVARFNAGQFERATGPLTRALEARSGDDQLGQMLALAWFNANEYERAARALADLPARRSNRGLEYAYGVALVRSNRGAEAEKVFADLMTRNADWPELNVLLAQAHAQQGDFETAVEQLERAIALDPEVAEAHATLGEIHLRRGELEKAEEELRSELRAHPDDTRTMFLLATALDLSQKPEEAIRLLRSLLGLEPRLGKGRYLLGKILLAEGSPEDALEQLQAAAGLVPEDANVHYQLGQAYQRLGQREKARLAFETYRRTKKEQR